MLNPVGDTNDAVAYEELSNICQRMRLDITINNNTAVIQLPVKITVPEDVLVDINLPVGHVCTICLTKDFKTWSQMPCNHKFHSSCVTTWLEQHNSCPLCRGSTT